MPLPPSWELWTLNNHLLSTLWPTVALESEPKRIPGRLCRVILSGRESFKTLKSFGCKSQMQSDSPELGGINIISI